jgi:hypothetical protein
MHLLKNFLPTEKLKLKFYNMLICLLRIKIMKNLKIEFQGFSGDVYFREKNSIGCQRCPIECLIFKMIKLVVNYKF